MPPEIDVTFVDRGRIEGDASKTVDGVVEATRSDPNPDAMRGEGVVYNLVIDHPEATILWDSGSHPDAGDGYWPEALYDAFTHADAAPLENDLDEAGYDLSDIDAVVQTHLHFDHAGGLHNFAGTDVPIYVHEKELKHAFYAAVTNRYGASMGHSTYHKPDFDHDLNWQVVRGQRRAFFEGVEFVHFPGHTPGLLGTLVGDEYLFTGDLAYVGFNYEHEHPFGTSLLWSRPHWEESVTRAKDIERRTGATVVYGHDHEQLDLLESLQDVG
jgi:glyoxylase-like metal-dependent hydrolase (beta-lactamase superfamily II)